MRIQVLVVVAGLSIALSVGALAGVLELGAPLVGWLAVGLVAVLWTVLYLTERVIGHEIWHYTAPYPYRGMQVTADAGPSRLESAAERQLADEEGEDIRLAA